MTWVKLHVLRYLTQRNLFRRFFLERFASAGIFLRPNEMEVQTQALPGVQNHAGMKNAAILTHFRPNRVCAGIEIVD